MTETQVLMPSKRNELGVSVIVPVYGGAAAIESLAERCIGVLRSMGTPYEVILVDDASPAPTCDIARKVAQTVPDVKLLRFARNSGQHAALLAGVMEARYSTIVTLDDDLQNPPEEIPRLIERLKVGDVDVVYGHTPQSSHAWIRRVASLGIRRVVARATKLDAIQYIGPYRAFRTELREGFAGAVGPGVSLDVLLSWSTQRFDRVEVRHDARLNGPSSYTLRKLVRFAFDTLTGYSTALLNVVALLGFAAFALGLGILVWVVGQYLLVGTSVAGFPFLASSIALFSGAQMLSLGIIGQYLGRVHLRVQGHPTYHIAERFPFASDKNAEQRDQ